MNKQILALVIGLGAVSSSQVNAAGGVFSVDPSAIGAEGNIFTADFLSGVSSGLVVLDAATQTATETGFMEFTGAQLNGSSIFGNGGLNVNYQLYATFSLTTALTSGVFGQTGSTYAITSLTYSIFANSDLANLTVFTAAAAFNAPSITDNGAADLLIGSGSLITGTAVITDLGGVALNSIGTYENTNPIGNAFFFSPDPFFTLAFTEFNNTTQGIAFDYTNADGCLAGTCKIQLTNLSGGVDFNNVPEPSVLALMGIGLLGFASKRKPM